jgi:hypothetical protein
LTDAHFFPKGIGRYISFSQKLGQYIFNGHFYRQR